MHSYTENLLRVFNEHKNPEYGSRMKQYMKGKFEYLGINSPIRKELSKPFLQKANLPEMEEVPGILKDIWNQPYRELFYTGIELAIKYSKKCPEDWIKLYEWMLVNHSWWDTVDGIASSLVGSYFKKFPESRDQQIDQWLHSENMWLQRTTIIFQLKYGKETDTSVLEKTIAYCKSSNEFFLRKAIGWALRQYGKFNPEYVKGFVADNPDLSNLSKKEALKHLI